MYIHETRWFRWTGWVLLCLNVLTGILYWLVTGWQSWGSLALGCFNLFATALVGFGLRDLYRRRRGP